MAKRLKEVHISRTESSPGLLTVWVDSVYDKDIAAIAGVSNASRLIPQFMVLIVGPRYDVEEVMAEIVELCR
jgi:hypothetical protein